MISKRSSLSAIFPFTSRYLDISVGGVACGRMHYVDEGSGPIVLCLHGNPTWCFYYRELVKTLSKNFRVIAPDYLGCGLSDRPPGKSFRAIERVEQLEAFVQGLGITRFNMVMHDWGGPIGTGLASRHLDSIGRLVYLNTTITETESLPLIIKRAATPPLGKWLTKYTKRFLKLTTEFGVAKRLPREVKQAYLAPYRRVRDRAAIWDFVLDIPFSDSHPTYADMLEIAEKLPEFSAIPVKLIWGLKDPCFHKGMLTKLSKHFPHADILELPNASHLVLEDESEVVCREILSFFTEAEQSSSDSQEGPLEPRIKPSLTHSPTPNPLYREVSKLASEGFSHDIAIVPEFVFGRPRYLHLNYTSFQGQVNSYQRGLVELGLKAGDKVLMLVAPGIEFLALSYAVMGRGAVPVFLDPGMGREKLFRCIKEVCPSVFIGSPKAQLLRVKQRELMPELRFSLTASDWFPARNYNLSYLKRFSSNPLADVQCAPEALIAFTSGGTGVPKGVIFTASMLSDQLRIFREVFTLESGKKDLPLLPIFSLFSAAVGVTSVFPPIDPARPLAVDAGKVVTIIRDLDVDYSFGSPTLWNKIGQYCVRTKSEIPSLRKVFMAGAPVPKEVISRVRSVAPKGEVYTPYGATEALPVTFVSGAEILSSEPEAALGGEIGTLVGESVSGVELRIIPFESLSPNTTDCDPQSLPARTIGEVIVRGNNISKEYFERPESTKAAKIYSKSGLWHRMGDLGYQDFQGRLYFCGRIAHMVRATDRIYYSVPTERIFNTHPKVRRSALISLGNEAPRAAICVEPAPQHWPESVKDKQDFALELRELAAANLVTEKITEFFFHKSFPVDARHNAKIFRDKLSLWAKNEASKSQGGPW